MYLLYLSLLYLRYSPPLICFDPLACQTILVFLTAKALEEKKQICQHFVIQLDNPTTILQQEEAKVFFTNNSDVKRYEFFFKATTLHA